MTAQPKLFDQVRNVLRVRHYPYAIEKSYGTFQGVDLDVLTAAYF
jgi:hypothetical protein